MAERVRLEVDADGVAILSLCDETGKNAFSLPFVKDLEAALASLTEGETATRAKVVIVEGLPDVFCAGGDRDVLLRLADGRVAPYDLKLTGALLGVPIPTIAAIGGHAVGGGLVFGLSCDVVLLGRESRYGFNFMEMGFTPGMGTTRLVQCALGEPLAAEMMFGGQYFRGKHFETRSLVNYVLPKADVGVKARGVAARFAEKPRFALELLKRSLSLDRRRAFEEARTMESMMHEICFAHPQTKARIHENYIQGESSSEEDNS